MAQFVGAFNDNAWKLLAALLGIAAVESGLDEPGGSALEAASQGWMTGAVVVFTLPLLFVSLPAVWLADRFGKRGIIVAMKAAELVLLAAGTVALAIAPQGATAALVVLGFLGVQTALFSPAKYGILPELLPSTRLAAGNGVLELWTFLAIVAGTAAGGTLVDWTGESPWIAGAALAALSAVGLAAALRIPVVPPAAERGERFADALRGAWRAITGRRALLLCALGLAWSWGIAALVGQTLLVAARTLLRTPGAEVGWADTGSAWVLAACGVGIGVGSWLAGKASRRRIEYGLIPCGALGLTLFLTLLAAVTGPVEPGAVTGRYALLLALSLLPSMALGFLLVPLDTLLQWRAPPQRRGAVIALVNVLVFAGVLAGSLAGGQLAAVGLPSSGILLVTSVLTLAGTVWAVWLLPDAFVRFALVVLTSTLYRLRIVGRDRVPSEGGVLLVPNHVSFVDGLLLLASIDRPIRFLVEDTYFQRRLLRPWMRTLGAIPISSSSGPREVLRALRNAGDSIDQGEVVCIFAEGQITRTGMLLPFKRGLERIVQGRDCAVVPVNLDRVWGSLLSWSGGRFVLKCPRRLPYRVTVSFGNRLPPGTPIHEIRRHVHELGEEAWRLRRADRAPLHASFLRECRRHPWNLCWADAERPCVRRIGALAATVALARALRAHWKSQERVGILLPPSVAGAAVNLAASLAGRVTVNLNFTVGKSGLESAVRQAGLSTVVTSRRFLERSGTELPEGPEPVWIEDVSAGIGRGARLAGLFLGLFTPRGRLERACGAERPVSVDDPVTVIFSSGSTGDPKGVVLSHFNIDSNVEALAQVERVHRRDRLLGILPLFHSFGYLALWFTANEGLGTVFHPNPLDAASVGKLVHRYRVSILIATPTFLRMYLRRCTAAQFGSLRLVLAGAEKMPEQLACDFEERFGIRPLEGYGTSECAPAVAASTLDYRAPGFYQPGSRRGSVGQPLPGVSVRVVDPEEEFDPERSEPLPPGTPGLLVVRGPNVMQGYLGRDDLTRDALRGGWYLTGDIASIDEDGFVSIHDRLARFSKIGGEMVPHGKVEQALHEAAEADELSFAVTSVPDERKGERLAVLHTCDEKDVRGLVQELQRRGLPSLYIPRAEQFLRVDELPLLGTGKLDLKRLREIARDQLVSAG